MFLPFEFEFLSYDSRTGHVASFFLSPVNYPATFQNIMDVPLSPPLRIQTLNSTSLSTKHAEKRMEAFIDDFQAKSTAAQGGNTAVTVQLQKLRNALHDERKHKH